MVLDDVLHISVLFVAQTQLVSVDFFGVAQDSGLGGVVLPTDHEILAIFVSSALVPEAFHFGRTVAVAGRTEITAKASQLVVDVLHAGCVLYADAI